MKAIFRPSYDFNLGGPTFSYLKEALDWVEERNFSYESRHMNHESTYEPIIVIEFHDSQEYTMFALYWGDSIELMDDLAK